MQGDYVMAGQKSVGTGIKGGKFVIYGDVGSPQAAERKTAFERLGPLQDALCALPYGSAVKSVAPDHSSAVLELPKTGAVATVTRDGARLKVIIEGDVDGSLCCGTSNVDVVVNGNLLGDSPLAPYLSGGMLVINEPKK